jgi:two-component system nitrogen regulation response regulator NtrX
VSKSKHILIVDDELEIRKIIQEILNDEGYSTSSASSAEEARIKVSKKKPDLVFLDIWMPNEDGISLLKDWTSQPETNFPVIMISGHATIETAIEATKLGAKDFIEKPVSIEKLLASVQEVLAQNLIGEDVFSHLVQNMPAFKKTLDEITPLVKQNNIFVLQGEEGLEKVAWARAIYLSQYSDIGEFQEIEFSGKEPFENEDSAALYKALEDKNNIAVYLENIHKLSEDEKSNIREGLMASAKKSTTKIFIGTSGKEETLFRNEERFTEINIPSLRASLKEIPQILDETVKFFVEKDGHGYRRFSLAAQNMLSKYQWPGNLRQLVDLVQALLSRRDKEIVNVDEIQEIITLQGPGGNILIENNILSLNMKEAKKLFERAYLTRQLELVGGKISELSRRVDMERTNLYRKLQSLDIEYKKKKKTTS